MLDEARHVAFGVLSLKDFYTNMPEAARVEREEFVYEAARLMRDRFLFQEVWEKAGLPVEECMNITLHNEGQKMFRTLLFSKIVPAIKKIGLLSPTLRERFAELGILQYESWGDPVADLMNMAVGVRSGVDEHSESTEAHGYSPVNGPVGTQLTATSSSAPVASRRARQMPGVVVDRGRV